VVKINSQRGGEPNLFSPITAKEHMIASFSVILAVRAQVVTLDALFE
jgi:hypothetical protein